ncbi:MAG: 50S ribosomal protein L24 [Anaerolineales bacterium]|jgi:large subunit ribosomal protein L24|nr:50S ribosomal protein L24 [Anaerolineales bacterium]
MRVKIRKGDTIEVISGRLEEQGKRGEVIKVLPDEHRVVVSGINVRTKHQRQVQTHGRTINPGRIKFEAPVDISNVMLVCPKCNTSTRVGVHRDDDGSHRVCKHCQAMID